MPYVNSKPHVGHAFEFILADAISRHHRQIGTKVHFNVGLDEHGSKVWDKSVELGLPVKDHINGLYNDWLKFCFDFRISYDSFYRTSDIKHHEFVQSVWNQFIKKGLIYKASYQGLYCKGCESFKTDRDIQNNKCPDHPTTELNEILEENWFFKLTDLKNQLLLWLDSSDNFLSPYSKRNELRNQILNAVDLSISRPIESCCWGIQVPGDSSQVVYVWFDALLNYISAAGYGTESFNWSNVLQFCGPDNLRFQGLVFQAFLLALEVKQTDRLVVHGTILDFEGKKMSKSLGNVIDPIEQFEKYGLDPVRYYALGGLNTLSNSSWSESELANLWNADICNEWGNLIARVLHLIDIKNHTPINVDKPDISEVEEAWRKQDSKEAVNSIRRLVKAANKELNEKTPWSSPDWAETLNKLYTAVSVINDQYRPLIPDSCLLVDAALLTKKKVIVFNKII